jgi:hypothetical protein
MQITDWNVFMRVDRYDTQDHGNVLLGPIPMLQQQPVPVKLLNFNLECFSAC